MTTTTEATEGQAKIRPFVESAIDRLRRFTGSEDAAIADLRMVLEILDASPLIVGGPVAWMRESDKALVKDRIKNDGEGTFQDFTIPLYAAQAPQSSPAPGVKPDGIMNEGYIEATRAHGSPAPSVIEAGDAMLARLHHSSPKCISGEKCVCGLAVIYERWDAAKASHPSVTAPKHMNLKDEARVWWDERYGGLNPDTTSATHERKMLAAFASHVLSLSPAAQGVTVDQIMEVVKRVRPITDECPRCDGMGCSGDVCTPRYWEQPMRSELSALLTK